MESNNDFIENNDPNEKKSFFKKLKGNYEILHIKFHTPFSEKKKLIVISDKTYETSIGAILYHFFKFIFLVTLLVIIPILFTTISTLYGTGDVSVDVWRAVFYSGMSITILFLILMIIFKYHALEYESFGPNSAYKKNEFLFIDYENEKNKYNDLRIQKDTQLSKINENKLFIKEIKKSDSVVKSELLILKTEIKDLKLIIKKAPKNEAEEINTLKSEIDVYQQKYLDKKEEVSNFKIDFEKIEIYEEENEGLKSEIRGLKSELRLHIKKQVEILRSESKNDNKT